MLGVYDTSGTPTIYGYLDGAATSNPSTTGSHGHGTGAAYMPRSGDYEIDIAWAGFWHRALDSDERTALFALDETSAFTDL